MGRYYIGDLSGKFKRITTSVRIRVDQLDRIRQERFNFSAFIEDCLDYYWGVRDPQQDIEHIKKVAEAVKKAVPKPISQEIKEIKIITKQRVFCPHLKTDVYEDFFKSDLCLYPNCEHYAKGLCRFEKPSDDEKKELTPD